MNILPHKSWHVRTKKNIARVRKDEAKAAEEEKETQRRIALAAQESRTAFLRERANQRIVENGEDLPKGIPLADVADIIQKDGHVNFFQEIEEGKIQEKVNVDHEEEKKKELEDYEKKIGYLVFLGQNSLEQTKEKPWYASIDRTITKELDKEREKFKSIEGSSSIADHAKSEFTTDELKRTKFKDFHDPLKSIRKYLTTPGVKKKLEHTVGEKSLKIKADSQPEEADPPKKSKKSKKEKKKKKKKHKHSTKKSKKHTKGKHARDPKRESDDETSDYSTDSEQERKNKKIHLLRAERLEREREERRRSEKALATLRGETIPEPKSLDVAGSTEIRSHRKQQYNSQFNPHLARQNFDN